MDPKILLCLMLTLTTVAAGGHESEEEDHHLGHDKRWDGHKHLGDDRYLDDDKHLNDDRDLDDHKHLNEDRDLDDDKHLNEDRDLDDDKSYNKKSRPVNRDRYGVRRPFHLHIRVPFFHMVLQSQKKGPSRLGLQVFPDSVYGGLVNIDQRWIGKK